MHLLCWFWVPFHTFTWNFGQYGSKLPKLIQCCRWQQSETLDVLNRSSPGSFTRSEIAEPRFFFSCDTRRQREVEKKNPTNKTQTLPFRLRTKRWADSRGMSEGRKHRWQVLSEKLIAFIRSFLVSFLWRWMKRWPGDILVIKQYLFLTEN